MVFSFYMDSGTAESGSYLTFPKSIANVGNMFDGDTSTFTCPHNGYYEFTFMGSVETDSPEGEAVVEIDKNGEKVMRFLDQRDDSLMSFTWIMKLSVGDKIRLYLYLGKIFRDMYHHSFFNGMLLNTV